MRLTHTFGIPLTVGVIVLATTVAGCHDSDNNGPPPPAMDHTNIVLKDRMGNALTANSTEPYSPRQTCGTCHDIDAIANGYHFQQGRTDKDGAIQVADNFFADGRTWLKSDGMYGKW